MRRSHSTLVSLPRPFSRSSFRSGVLSMLQPSLLLHVTSRRCPLRLFLSALLLTLGGCRGEKAASVDRAVANAPPAAPPAPATRVTLTEAGLATAGIRTAPVQRDTGSVGADGRALQVPGQVEADPRRVAVVSSRISGQLEHLSVVEGDRVEAGQVVAELFSPEYLTAQSDVQLAERRAAVLRGSPDEQGARALADAAARRLRMLGSTEAEVTALRQGNAPASVLSLRSPLAGSIVRAHALAGEALAAGAPVFTVADLSIVDLVAEIPEVSLALVRVGQAATITIAAFPALRIRGTVELLREQLNPDTRTVRAVIHVGNATRALRPGMYASVWIDVGGRYPGALATPGLLIPETAIVNDGADRIVFVEVAARTYERRVVRVESLAPEGSLRPAGREVRIADGLRAGERVVTHGAFLLKSELNKSSDPEDE